MPRESLYSTSMLFNYRMLWQQSDSGVEQLRTAALSEIADITNISSVLSAVWQVFLDLHVDLRMTFGANNPRQNIDSEQRQQQTLIAQRAEKLLQDNEALLSVAKPEQQRLHIKLLHFLHVTFRFVGDEVKAYSYADLLHAHFQQLPNGSALHLDKIILDLDSSLDNIAALRKEAKPRSIVDLGAEQGATLENFYVEQATKLEKLTTQLREITATEETSAQLAAAHGRLARAYRKLDKFDAALMCHRHAYELAPQNNVILNNYAITLSKCAGVQYLLQAQTLLQQQFTQDQTTAPAGRTLLFATPYYLADVYRKLAHEALERTDTPACIDYLTQARTALQAAQYAAQHNERYSVAYREKSLLRCRAAELAILALEQQTGTCSNAQLAAAKQAFDDACPADPNPRLINKAQLYAAGARHRSAWFFTNRDTASLMVTDNTQTETMQPRTMTK